MSRHDPVGAWLDGLSDRLDAWPVNASEDLSRLGQRGVHYARGAAADEIEKNGLGRHPDMIEDHEIEPWIATRLSNQDARRAAAAVLAGERWDAGRLVEASLMKLPRLRVIWFSTDPAYTGATSSGHVGSTLGGPPRRISFDLGEVGAWAKRFDAVVFTDNADGWGLSWVGPPIPRSLFRFER